MNDMRHNPLGKIWAFLLACLLLLTACGPAAPATETTTAPVVAAPTEPPPQLPTTLPPTQVPTAPLPAIRAQALATADEQPIIAIPLASLAAGPSTDPAAEYSGLAWYGNWLILLPQYLNPIF